MPRRLFWFSHLRLPSIIPVTSCWCLQVLLLLVLLLLRVLLLLLLRLAVLLLLLLHEQRPLLDEF
jgi:hypothetical protein